MEDQERLKSLALSDPYEKVREAAFNRITRQDIFEDIFRLSRRWEVRLAALKKLDSVERRVELALQDNRRESHQVLIPILIEINDQEVLIEAFQKSAPYQGKKEIALKNISDQAFLKDVLFGAFKENFRLIAFNRLLELDGLDEDTLKRVMKTSRRDRELRLAAFEQIGDLEFIKKLALSEPKGEIRHRATQLWTKTLSPQLADQNQIKRLALYASNSKAQTFAWDLLHDPRLLEDIALRGEQTWQRIKAIEKITNDDILKQLTFNDPEQQIREAAAQQMSNEELLFKIIMTHKGIDYKRKRPLVKKLTDPSKLRHIALSHKQEFVRKQAIEQLKDPHVLKKVIEQDRSSVCRSAAMKRLDDHEVLTELAMNHSDYDIRKSAVQQLTDQDVLAKVAQNDEHSSVRQAAVLRLYRQDDLKRIILNDQDSIVRSTAVTQIKDERMIEQLALTDSDPRVRYWAVRRVFNPDILKEIVSHDTSKDVRTTAERMMKVLSYKSMENQEQLAEIVLQNHYVVAKEEALKLVDDTQLLKKIVKEFAHSQKFKDIRISAMAKIDDPSVLTELVTGAFHLLRDHSLAEQQEVLDKIDQPELLAKLGRTKNINEQIRETVLLKIDDQNVFASILLKTKFIEILDRINEPAALKRVILHHPDATIRMQAALKCEDADTLVEAGLKDFSLLNRWKVLERLHELEADPEHIQSVEQKLINTSLRWYLAAKGWEFESLFAVVDADLFKNILAYRKNFFVHESILLLMNDQDLLKKKASSNLHWMLRIAALPGITDQEFLKKRAVEDPVEQVRIRAVSLIKDQSLLRDLAFDGFYKATRHRAIQLLLDPEVQNRAREAEQKLTDNWNISNEQDMLEMALTGKYDVWRIKATNQITSKDQLKIIALQSNFTEVLSIVLEKLDSPDILREIATSAQNPSMRVAATQKSGLKTWGEIFQTGQTRSEGVYAALNAILLFKSNDYRRGSGARNAAYYLLSRGDISRIPEIIEILNRFGSKTLAQDLYNCGQPDLKEAARQWAKQRNFAIISYPTSHAPDKRWGMR